MFDIGWTELLVVAVVAIVFVGPKDLPHVLRTLAQAIGKMRKLAGEFQSQFNEALKEAELDDLKKEVEGIRDVATLKGVRDEINPFKQADQELRDLTSGSALDKPSPASGPMSGAAPEGGDGDAPASGNPSPEAAGSVLDEMLEEEDSEAAERVSKRSGEK